MFNFFKKKKEEETKEKTPVEKCCATCKWVKVSLYNDDLVCRNPERPKTTTFNPVTGSKEVYATMVCEYVMNRWCKLNFWEGK